MKNYFCKRCNFTGTRRSVRDHIKETHLYKHAKSGKTPFNIKNEPSPITKLMGRSENETIYNHKSSK